VQWSLHARTIAYTHVIRCRDVLGRVVSLKPKTIKILELKKNCNACLRYVRITM